MSKNTLTVYSCLFVKKASTKVCSNYCLIALISHASTILLHRLNSNLIKGIVPEQRGFVKDMGACEPEEVKNVHHIIEKATEFKKPTYLLC